jgi:hypothetical protein
MLILLQRYLDLHARNADKDFFFYLTLREDYNTIRDKGLKE